MGPGEPSVCQNVTPARRRGPRFIRVAAGLLALLLIAYSPVLAIRCWEYFVAFHPEPYKPEQPWTLPRNGEDVWFDTRDGLRLHGWLIQAQKKPATGTIIYFHGNGGNIANVAGLGESLSERGFDVLLFDYRGYGRSEGRIHGERDVYADADTAYDYVVRGRDVAPNRLALYGQSLGTTAVADLASRRPCGAVVLESGPSSASALASALFPWFPRWLHWMLKNRFDSARKLRAVHCPVLITHGDPDSIIPTQNARELYAAANEPKKLLLVPGADHNVFGSAGDEYLNQIADFIRQALIPPQSQSS